MLFFFKKSSNNRRKKRLSSICQRLHNFKHSLKRVERIDFFNYQFDKLNEYLKENRGMKLNATINMKVVNLFDEERNVTVRTRSYTIVNEEDLRNALKIMRPDVETRILDMALYQSGLIISNINNIHIMYNKYNPTRAGK